MNRPNTSKRTKTNMANDKDTVSHDEKIVLAMLSHILVDYSWNVRSKADIERESTDGVRDGSKEAGLGQNDFIRSFNEGGQDTPCIVAEVVNGKTIRGQKTDKKYELIAGFRRFNAIEKLNTKEDTEKRKAHTAEAPSAHGTNIQAVANVPDGHIKVIVRKFKDAREARKLNARENTLRSNLQAPDLVRLCLEYSKDFGLNQTETSAELGIVQSYVSKLLKVGTLPAVILAHWREGADLPGGNPPSAKQLPINDMKELADYAEGQPLPEVIDRYKKLLSPTNPEDQDPTKQTPADKVVKELEATGFLLGAFVAKGILDNGSLAWGSVMGPGKSGFLLNTGPKALDAEAQGKFHDIFQLAFERGIAHYTKK